MQETPLSQTEDSEATASSKFSDKSTKKSPFTTGKHDNLPPTPFEPPSLNVTSNYVYEPPFDTANDYHETSPTIYNFETTSDSDSSYSTNSDTDSIDSVDSNASEDAEEEIIEEINKKDRISSVIKDYGAEDEVVGVADLE